jgi:hypothetical protein
MQQDSRCPHCGEYFNKHGIATHRSYCRKKRNRAKEKVKTEMNKPENRGADHITKRDELGLDRSELDNIEDD